MASSPDHAYSVEPSWLTIAMCEAIGSSSKRYDTPMSPHPMRRPHVSLGNARPFMQPTSNVASPLLADAQVSVLSVMRSRSVETVQAEAGVVIKLRNKKKTAALNVLLIEQGKRADYIESVHREFFLAQSGVAR